MGDSSNVVVRLKHIAVKNDEKLMFLQKNGTAQFMLMIAWIYDVECLWIMKDYEKKWDDVIVHTNVVVGLHRYGVNSKKW